MNGMPSMLGDGDLGVETPNPPSTSTPVHISHYRTHLASAFSAQPYQLAWRTFPPPLPGTMAMRIPPLFPSAMAPRRTDVWMWRPAA